jgi:sugar lactone lactonase YvrE
VDGGCKNNYAPGTLVTLTAHPTPGHAVETWLFAPASCTPGSLTCTVTMDQARFIWVFFGPAGGGGGSSAPTLTSCSPSSGIHGSTGPATCTGTNFVPDATSLAFSGTGVIINSISVQNSTTLSVHWTLGGALGTRTISVTTPNGTSNTINFNITADAISGATAFTPTTYSGTGGVAGSANGAVAAATYNGPWGIWGDGPNLYIVEDLGARLRKVVFTTGQVSTLTTSLGGPRAIWVNQFKAYVSDAAGGGRIYEVDLGTGVATPFAGSGSPGNANGTGIAAQFNGISAMWGDGPNLYVADTLNHTIRKIVIATKVVTTIAGTPGTQGFANGVGGAALFRFPMGITGDGNFLYVSDSSNHVIRQIDLATNTVTTIAGQNGVAGQLDGPVSSSTYNSPRGMWTDGTNYIYIVDAVSGQLRRLSIATAATTTISLPPGTLSTPVGIWSDSQVLYISNLGNHTITKVSPN